MTEIADFGLIVLVVVGDRLRARARRCALADRLALPTAALFLVAAASSPSSSVRSRTSSRSATVERLAVVALDRDPLRRRAAHRLAPVPRLRGPILVLGVLGTFATAGARRGRGALRCSASSGSSRARRRRARADRSGGHVLGPRRPRDPRALGHDPRGRGGRERPGRDRADDRDDRARDERRRLVLDRRQEFAIEMAIGLAVGVAGALAARR